MQGFAEGGSNCFGAHATACGLSDLGDAGAAGTMDGIGAIAWASTVIPLLGDRAEAGTAIAAKKAKISRILKLFRLASGRLQNDEREATSSRRQSKPSFMHNTRNDGRAVLTICRAGNRLKLAGILEAVALQYFYGILNSLHWRYNNAFFAMAYSEVPFVE